LSARFATLIVDEPGDELERLLAHLQRELIDEAGVTWTEPIPVQGTTVVVQFLEDATPSAEDRVRDILDNSGQEWRPLLEFAVTSP
jgi:hypothetical protein